MSPDGTNRGIDTPFGPAPDSHPGRHQTERSVSREPRRQRLVPKIPSHSRTGAADTLNTDRASRQFSMHMGK